jgi:hypothetical protein
MVEWRRQVVPVKHKALRSTPSTTKQTNKQTQIKFEELNLQMWVDNINPLYSELEFDAWKHAWGIWYFWFTAQLAEMPREYDVDILVILIVCE